MTFFGIQATRAWIGKKFIKVYNPDDKEDQLKYVSLLIICQFSYSHKKHAVPNFQNSRLPDRFE